MFDQRNRVRDVTAMVWRRLGDGTPGTAAIIGQHTTAARELRGQLAPHARVGAGAMDEHNAGPSPVALVLQIDPVKRQAQHSR